MMALSLRSSISYIELEKAFVPLIWGRLQKLFFIISMTFFLTWKLSLLVDYTDNSVSINPRIISVDIDHANTFTGMFSVPMELNQ